MNKMFIKFCLILIKHQQKVIQQKEAQISYLKGFIKGKEI